MKKTAFCLGTLVLLATLVAPVASGASPVSVSIPVCLNPLAGNGQRSVEPGSTITLTATWADIGRGSVIQFLEAVTVTATIDGTPVANASSLFGPIELASSGAPVWLSQWRHETGITLEDPGDEMVVYYAWDLSRRVRSVAERSFYGPGLALSGTCTITAV